MDTEKLLNNMFEYDYYDYPFDYFITDKLKDDVYMDDVFDMTYNQLLSSLENKICLGHDEETISKNIKNILTVLTYSKKRYITSKDCLSVNILQNVPTEHDIINSMKTNVDFI